MWVNSRRQSVQTTTRHWSINAPWQPSSMWVVLNSIRGLKYILINFVWIFTACIWTESNQLRAENATAHCRQNSAYCEEEEWSRQEVGQLWDALGSARRLSRDKSHATNDARSFSEQHQLCIHEDSQRAKDSWDDSEKYEWAAVILRYIMFMRNGRNPEVCDKRQWRVKMENNNKRIFWFLRQLFWIVI